jgi:hypothetical protein
LGCQGYKGELHHSGKGEDMETGKRLEVARGLRVRTGDLQDSQTILNNTAMVIPCLMNFAKSVDLYNTKNQP